jgi:hypothetical protein
MTAVKVDDGGITVADGLDGEIDEAYRHVATVLAETLPQAAHATTAKVGGEESSDHARWARRCPKRVDGAASRRGMGADRTGMGRLRSRSPAAG